MTTLVREDEDEDDRAFDDGGDDDGALDDDGDNGDKPIKMMALTQMPRGGGENVDQTWAGGKVHQVP